MRTQIFEESDESNFIGAMKHKALLISVLFGDGNLSLVLKSSRIRLYTPVLRA